MLGQAVKHVHGNRRGEDSSVRNAYRHGDVLQSQDDRVFVRGPFGNGIIELWVNRATKEIESAWPEF